MPVVARCAPPHGDRSRRGRRTGAQPPGGLERRARAHPSRPQRRLPHPHAERRPARRGRRAVRRRPRGAGERHRGGGGPGRPRAGRRRGAFDHRSRGGLGGDDPGGLGPATGSRGDGRGRAGPCPISAGARSRSTTSTSASGTSPPTGPRSTCAASWPPSLVTVPDRLADAGQRRRLLAWLTGRSSSPGRLDLDRWESRPGNYLGRGALMAGQRAGPDARQPSSLKTRDGVVAEELGPDVVAQRDVGELGEDALQSECHRVVPGVHDLVGTPGVGVVDDRLRVVLRGEGARHVVEAGPLEHQLDGQFLPGLGPVSHDDAQFGEVVADLVEVHDVLARGRHPRPGDPGVHDDGQVEVDARLVHGVVAPVADRAPGGCTPPGTSSPP